MHTGPSTLAVISGNRWARGRSMLSTWSTMTCFIWPLEVSRMVPRGILGSFSKIFSRMDFRMEKVALWEMDRAREYRLARSRNPARATAHQVR